MSAHDELIVQVTLGQPAGGSQGLYLVYIDVVDPNGTARLDGHEEGGLYMVLLEEVRHEFRFLDAAAGDWKITLELWYMSVPVEFAIEWTAP